MSTREPRAGRGDDAGFGLTEIMVSLMLLGLLALAFAPLMVNALSASARNQALNAATQLANEKIEELRGAARTCADLKNQLDKPVDPEKDSQGRTYTFTQTPSSAVTCPSGDGSILVDYTIEVRVDGPSAPPPVRITTQIWTVTS